MRIRRLRILGVAMVLSGLAALVGVVCYLAPKERFATVNRLADFVVINDTTFWLRDGPLREIVRFPNYDTENEHLRLIAIDEVSLQDAAHGGIGAFPWPRSVYGTLLKRLHQAGASVVAFDVTFPDPSTPAQDRAFAEGLKTQRAVDGFSITTPGGRVYAELPIPDVRNNAAIGFTTVDTPGGWTVGQPLVNGPYESLAAKTIEAHTAQPIRARDDWHASLGRTDVPLDGESKFLMLPFQVIENTEISSAGGARLGSSSLTLPFFQAIPAVTALSMSADDMRAFAGGNVIVIGTTAQALGDFVVTPNGRYPGVFTNLRLMDQLMRSTYIRRVPPAVDLALIVLFPLLVGFLVTQLRPIVGIALGAGVVVLYSIFAVLAYALTLHWINLVHVDASIALAALFVALYRTVTEGADKRVITEMFGKHVSPAIVEHMLAHDDPLKALDLSGKRVKVTIFYSDIRGFTAMSEKMSPEEIYGALNEYFEEMCQIVFQYGGFVDKFIGDCLMAVFSAPNPQPNDAYNAVRSAWEQQQKILTMMTEWAAQGRPIFTVGMGLNTGEVVMGNLGSADRLNYTVIGDNVNTAARLYNVAKGGQTIISESTYEEVKDRFIVNELTPVFVKGKTLPLRNFEVIGLLEPGHTNTSTLLDPENLPQATVAADHYVHGLTPLGAFGLFLIGAGASVFGSLVGLGGGFVVIPVLRLAFGIPPAEVAGTSLVLVLANTASSTIGFWRHKTIDFGLALPFTLGAVPASILGVFAVRRITPAGFDIAYGTMLVTLAILVIRRRGIESRPVGERTFANDWRVGVAGGLAMGFFSSAFGIGGGFVMVPLLLIAARMPPHIVAATTAFVVTMTAPIGVAGHALAGDIDWAVTTPLVLGGIAGGGIAPSIAKRVSSPTLITMLAIGLIAAACSLALRHLPIWNR